MTPNPEPKRPAPQGPDNQMQEAGLQIVVALCAVIRIARSYESSNQAFKLQLKNFAECLKPVLATQGEVVLVVVDGELYLNGARVPVNSFSFRFHRTVVEGFKRAAIAGLRVSGEADPVELGKFFGMLLDTLGPKGKDMVKACSAAGFAHTQPALYSMDDDDDSGENQDRATPSGSSKKSLFKTLHEAAGGESAEKRMADVLQGAQSVLSPASLQAGVELRLAKRVVQPLVDAAVSSEPLLVGLSVIQDPERSVYGHAINVAGFAVAIGHAFGLDRMALADLGVAALFHDVGMSALDVAPQETGSPMSEQERSKLRRHTIEGAKLIAATTTLNRTSLCSMRVALEHHVRAGRTGYPTLPDRWKTSLLSRIVSVADCYVSLLNRQRGDGTRVTPSMALGMILGPLQARFEAPLLRAMVQSIGFYPPGQGLELNDGTLAVSIAPNRSDLTRPHVMVVANAHRQLLPENERLVLRPLPREMSVVRPLSAEELPLAPESDSQDPPAVKAA